MLRDISPLISPQLLEALAAMGHSDRIVFADANFPSQSLAQAGNCKYIRLDGQSMVPLLQAVLQLFPLDSYVSHPALLMEKEPSDQDLLLPIINDYKALVANWDSRGEKAVGYLARQSFYEESKKAACIVHTGETALYANIILTKGVVIHP